jgi:2-dehydro-3-deoxygluconokinase
VTRVLVVGEPLVEELEAVDGSTRRGFGGDALNLAVYLARTSKDLHVLLASAAGDDRDSDALLRFCREEGVDASYVRRVAGATLGRYRVTVDDSGERSFTYRRSASPFRGALDEGVGLPDPSGVDVLCLSGITLAVLHDAGRRTLLDLAEAIRRSDGMVVYDPNHRPALWADDADARRWTRRIAPIAHLLLASTEDGRRLTDATSASEIAGAFRAMGASEVVVTDGADPCIVAVDGSVDPVAAIRSGDIADTTAAGDAFDAGYLAARLRGASPQESAAAGHALAAAVVGHRGAFASREDPS